MALIEEDLTYSVIGAFLAVFNKLGDGFLENVYIGALVIELERRGHRVQREVPIAVKYDGIVVGTYRIDLLIDGKLVVEVKAGAGQLATAERQLRHYLRCSDMELGLLLVFDEKPIHRRLIHTNNHKGA